MPIRVSPIFRGHAPQNLTALRNAGLNCLRQLEIDNITATLRSFARKTAPALTARINLRQTAAP